MTGEELGRLRKEVRELEKIGDTFQDSPRVLTGKHQVTKTILSRATRRLGRFGWLPWVLAAGLAIRMFLFTGIAGTDDVVYPARAYSLLLHRFDPAGDLFSARIGYVTSLAVVFSIFGIHPVSLALPSLISSMLMMLLAWTLGRALDDERLGVLAAAIVALLPLDIYYASDGHLDLLQAMLGSFAIYLLWRSGQVPTEAGALRYGLLAGGLFGLAHLVKETAFFFLIPALWLMWQRKYRPAITTAVAIYAATVAAEMTAYALFRGDAMTRFHLIHAQVESVRVPGNGGVLARAAEFAASAMSPEGALFKHVGSMIWLALSGTVMVLLRDRERWAWIVVWLFGLVLAIGFWPRTVLPFHPALGLYARFFTGLIVPGALLAARFFSYMTRRLGATLGALAFAALASFNLLCALINYEDAARWRSGPEWAHRVLMDHPHEVVITDFRTMVMLRFLAKYEPPYELRPLDSTMAPPAANTLVLDNEAMVTAERAWDGAIPPSWWSADAPSRQPIAQLSIQPRFSLRGRYEPVTRISLSRIVP